LIIQDSPTVDDNPRDVCPIMSLQFVTCNEVINYQTCK